MSHHENNNKKKVLTLFKIISRLNRNGNKRLFSDRWLPMLEFVSSLAFCGSGGFVVVAGATIPLASLLIVINVASLLLGTFGALELSRGGSGLDIFLATTIELQIIPLSSISQL